MVSRNYVWTRVKPYLFLKIRFAHYGANGIFQYGLQRGSAHCGKFQIFDYKITLKQ